MFSSPQINCYETDQFKDNTFRDVYLLTPSDHRTMEFTTWLYNKNDENFMFHFRDACFDLITLHRQKARYSPEKVEWLVSLFDVVQHIREVFHSLIISVTKLKPRFIHNLVYLRENGELTETEMYITNELEKYGQFVNQIIDEFKPIIQNKKLIQKARSYHEVVAKIEARIEKLNETQLKEINDKLNTILEFVKNQKQQVESSVQLISEKLQPQLKQSTKTVDTIRAIQTHFIKYGRVYKAEHNARNQFLYEVPYVAVNYTKLPEKLKSNRDEYFASLKTDLSSMIEHLDQMDFFKTEFGKINECIEAIDDMLHDFPTTLHEMLTKGQSTKSVSFALP